MRAHHRILITILLLGFALSAKAQLLDSLALDTMLGHTNLQEALKEPDKVIKLVLRKQKLTAMPAEILKFKNLQYLDLSKNKIKKLPEGIDTLKQLQFLILSKNLIEELPKQIGDLPNLKHLNVNQNELETLPAQIGKLEKLEYLDLWSNNLNEFPEEMKYLKNLKVLDLRVILISDEQQTRLKNLLPKTTIHFSKNCNCEL